MTIAVAVDPAPGFQVRRYHTRAAMAHAAASDIAAHLRDFLDGQERLRMVFAAAPSQAEMLAGLAAAPGIDWRRITAFHMDEYLGLEPGDPASFVSWLRKHFFDRVPIGKVHLIEPGDDPEATSAKYAALLGTAPIDVVCLGIGVNGHIAFNDPPVADFNDPLDVKVVTLDQDCRQQQVDEGCFRALDLVPRQAMTITVPPLMRANRLFAVVPGAIKREAVRRTLQGPVSTDCPASILRTHPNCTLYLDKESDPNG